MGCCAPQGIFPVTFAVCTHSDLCPFPISWLPSPPLLLGAYSLWVSLHVIHSGPGSRWVPANDSLREELITFKAPTQPSSKYRPGANRNFLIPNPDVGEPLTETAQPDWHHSKHLHELFVTGDPGDKPPPPTGRIQKSQKETGEHVHMSYQPLRTLLTRIHLGWVMLMPLSRTLHQLESETIQDWSYHQKLETGWATCRYRNSHPHRRAVFLLSTQALLPQDLVASTFVSPHNSFLSVRE